MTQYTTYKDNYTDPDGNPVELTVRSSDSSTNGTGAAAPPAAGSTQAHQDASKAVEAAKSGGGTVTGQAVLDQIAKQAAQEGWSGDRIGAAIKDYNASLPSKDGAIDTSAIDRTITKAFDDKDKDNEGKTISIPAGYHRDPKTNEVVKDGTTQTIGDRANEQGRGAGTTDNGSRGTPDRQDPSRAGAPSSAGAPAANRPPDGTTGLPTQAGVTVNGHYGNLSTQTT